jgi:hypothetical protein
MEYNKQLFQTMKELPLLPKEEQQLLKGHIILDLMNYWGNSIINELLITNTEQFEELFNESYLILNKALNLLRTEPITKKKPVNKKDYLINNTLQYADDADTYFLFEEYNKALKGELLPANYNFVFLLRQTLKRDLIRIINKNKGKRYTEGKLLLFEIPTDISTIKHKATHPNQDDALLWTLLSKDLTKNELVAYCNYSAGMSYREIGLQLLMTKQGAEYHYKKALNKMRDKWNNLNK